MVPHALYTREQADAVLPLVRAIVEDQREVYLRVRRSLSAIRSLGDLDAVEGDRDLPKGLRDDLAELRGYLLELHQLGAKVEDPELGLVTLRGVHRGDVVNFCWKLGEDRVRFFYADGAGYAGRRPIDAVAV